MGTTADAEAPSPRTLPAPQVNPETRAVFEAAAQGVLLIGRCDLCARAHYYPRSLCPFCFGPCRFEAASGTGEIYTLSVTYRGAPEPYAVGYVSLDEGPRLFTTFVDAPLESFNIGQRVRVRFVPTDGGPPVQAFGPV